MITTSQSRRARIFELALTLSLVVHLLGLLVYAGLLEPYFTHVRRLMEKPEDLAAVTDVVRIEKRIVPRPAQVAPPRVHAFVARPAPAARPLVERPVTKPRAVAKPAEPHEVARLYRQASPQPLASPNSADYERQRAPIERQSQQRTNGQLSSEQLASLDQQFRQTIAQSKADLANIPAPASQPMTTRRFSTLMNGSLRNIRQAQGWVQYFEHCPGGMPHCYYLRVNMIWPDGYSEIVDIPWPFHFSSSYDPLQRVAEGAAHVQFPVQDPPDSFRLPHPFALSRLLCTYFHDECQAVLDAEQRNGGAPATN